MTARHAALLQHHVGAALIACWQHFDCTAEVPLPLKSHVYHSSTMCSILTPVSCHHKLLPRARPVWSGCLM